MKKLLFLGIPALVALLVLALPAGIGWLINDRAAAALQEHLPAGASADWDRGWLRSALRLVTPGYRAELDFRHTPMRPPGWLAVDGRVILQEPAAAVEVDGHLWLSGKLTLALAAPRLDIPGPVAWQYREPSMRLVTEGDRATLTGSARQLLIHDALGNRLALEQARLTFEMSERAGTFVDLALEIGATRLDRERSRIRVRIETVDARAAEEFFESLSAWLGAEPGSAAAGIAALGLASAWEQLASKGLALKLEELTLDGATDVTGTWVPAERRWRLSGDAGREAALDWWAGVTGLARRLPPDQARLEARTGLEGFAADGLVELTPGRIRLELENPAPNQLSSERQGPP